MTALNALLNAFRQKKAYLMLSSYEHRDSEEIIQALELFLRIYAEPRNWLEEPQGEPPHHLRRGKRLAFSPPYLVDGYRFAEEALAALARFRGRRAVASEVSELVWHLDLDAAPPDVWLWGWITGGEDGDFTSPVQVTVRGTGRRIWRYRYDKIPLPTALTVIKWAYDPAAEAIS